MSNEKPKVFDEFYKVNCNECTRYWDSSCDGTNIEKPCNSYIATRDVVIPAQIEELKKRFKGLAFSTLLLGIACTIHFGSELLSRLFQ